MGSTRRGRTSTRRARPSSPSSCAASSKSPRRCLATRGSLWRSCLRSTTARLPPRGPLPSKCCRPSSCLQPLTLHVQCSCRSSWHESRRASDQFLGTRSHRPALPLLLAVADLAPGWRDVTHCHTDRQKREVTASMYVCFQPLPRRVRRAGSGFGHPHRRHHPLLGLLMVGRPSCWCPCRATLPFLLCCRCCSCFRTAWLV
mmetsp:Transcript_35668/g.114994  ORF Transcript_35668/g.114994 Transcript_35668/m.114994 type:complete len:201 (+) Transcript_35668:565-1167(+)